jgi:hypothetical protein
MSARTGTPYMLRLAGHLDHHWATFFDGLTLTHEDDGTTTLHGDVADQSALHGLLSKVRDLGATLLSVEETTVPSDSGFVPPDSPASTGLHELPLYRLHLMRAGYLLMGLGLAVVKWPLLLDDAHSLPLFEGVVACLLTAMSLLAFLGLRHPLKLLPVLLFEVMWKLLWLSVVALPAAASGDLDESMQEVAVNSSLVLVIIAVTPWRYVWRQYVTAPGERWR